MYDPDEQQQLEDIRKWFARHGKWVFAAVAVASVSLGGYFAYAHYQRGEAEKASTQYDALLKLQGDKDLKKIRLAASAIMESYPKTPYASRAALFTAKQDFETGDLNDAKLQLRWVLDHSPEQEVKDVARLHLARVQFDEGKYQEAVSTLDVKHDDAFDGLYSDLKGDIYFTQGRKAEARSAYLVALNKIDKGSTYHDLLQIKLESAGGGK